MDLRIDWTPVFTGVTNEFQFFHSFRGKRGIDSLKVFVATVPIQNPFRIQRFHPIRKILLELKVGTPKIGLILRFFRMNRPGWRKDL
jgi:hypothetical protein